jgi:hypothetical protein
MKNPIRILLFGTVLLGLLCGCRAKFDPQKNLLCSKCFGWWYIEVPKTNIIPGHIMFLQLEKDGAVLIDYARGSGARATGTYSFHEGSRRNQGTFDLYLNGKLLRSDFPIGNWVTTFSYERRGLKYTVSLVSNGQKQPFQFKYREREEGLILQELDAKLQEFMRREAPRPATTPPGINK